MSGAFQHIWKFNITSWRLPGMSADIAAIPATYSADDSKSHAGFSAAMGWITLPFLFAASLTNTHDDGISDIFS